jgi:O-antigen ligase
LSDCAIDRDFCNLWRSAGFLMSFGVALEGMTALAFIIVVAGGRQKRVFGWKVLCCLLTLVALVQAAGMGTIVSLNFLVAYDTPIPPSSS